MKYVLGFIGILIGITLLGLGLRVLLFPINVAQNYVNTAYDINNKTLNADNAIYNYEWFKQTFEDINAAKAQLGNATISLDSFVQSAGERSSWTFEDKQEQSRLSAVNLGLQNHLETLIANYNARSKMANRAIFTDTLLPTFIDSLTFIKQ